MKRIVLIISILAVSFSSCNLLSCKGEENKDVTDIQRAESDAVKRIKEASTKEIKSAITKIDSATTNIIVKADTTLTKELKAIGDKAKKIKDDIDSRNESYNKYFRISYIVGIAGIVMGIVGLIIAILAYRKKSHTNVERIRELIFEDSQIHNYFKNIIVNPNIRSQSSYAPTVTQQHVIQELKNYIDSEGFKVYLKSVVEEMVKTPLSSIRTETLTDSSSGKEGQPAIKRQYVLFAKESNSMHLSDIQESYEKGKSVYKLILSSPDSNTAQVSLCVEQEGAKDRILVHEGEYLKPICDVSLLSNEPSTVEVKKEGYAERIGEEWEVKNQVIVEIK